MTDQTIDLLPFQQKALLIPEAFDLFLGGGRGGGKSYALALLALRHVEQYGEQARILYIRRTYKGLADFELVTRELFGQVYNTAARFNAQEHVWRFPNGAYLELGQLESHADYPKYQGRSFTLLLVDEAGQYDSPDLLDLLRSNLRGGKNVPIRMVVAANPGGIGHHWLARRYVFGQGRAPWHPFHEDKSKRQWVYCPSTFSENHAIDRDQYADQLQASCPSDPELLRAWVSGDWAVNRGAYFASVLEESRNAINPLQEIPNAKVGYAIPWRSYLAHDFGSSAPSVTYLIVKSPGGEMGGKFYPRGSLIVVDELATNKPGKFNEGLGWTVPDLAEAIRAMCKRWGVKAHGVADDAIFARTGSGAGSISEEFNRAGVYFSPARKADRVSGWQSMRRLFADAGKPDVPGLYVSRSCEYFWATVPNLGRDTRKPEDVDSSGADHGADALRYGCIHGMNSGVKVQVVMP